VAFKKATKLEAKARIAILGPSGSGKSYTGLSVAREFGKLAAIDTEHGTLSKYSDLFDFDVLELTTFAPAQYTLAISEAQAAGYDALLIDSLSHAWNGIGGLLAQADKVEQRGGNKFAAWADLTPQHLDLIEAMHACKMHLVVTMRSKQEYVLEQNSKGKQVPRKVGMAAVQRDGMEYEFDCVLEMDYAHVAHVSKTRCAELDGLEIEKPGKAFADTFKRWLSGEKRREPWELEVFQGTGPLAGLLVSESTPTTIAGYIETVRTYIKRNPQLNRAAVDKWNAHIAVCVEAQRQLDQLPASYDNIPNDPPKDTAHEEPA
jgi:hypothetical protein